MRAMQGLGIPADILQKDGLPQRQVGANFYRSIEEMLVDLKYLQQKGEFDPTVSNRVLDITAFNDQPTEYSDEPLSHATGIQIDPQGNYALWDVNHCLARYTSIEEVEKAFADYLASMYDDIRYGATCLSTDKVITRCTDPELAQSPC